MNKVVTSRKFSRQVSPFGAPVLTVDMATLHIFIYKHFG